MEGRKNSRTTSRDGTSSKGRRPAPAVSLAQHAGKFDPDLGRLLERVAGLAPRIRRELPVRRDPARTRNVYGEQQLELDVWMNDRFVDALRASKLVAQVASEEMGQVKEVGHGRFSVVLDPLDGSSNVKSNNIFGTIFGVFDRTQLPARGSELFAAGYTIYGPATTFVYATSTGVHEFVQGGGPPNEFILIEEGLRLPPKGKLYGIGGHPAKRVPEGKGLARESAREMVNPPDGGPVRWGLHQNLPPRGVFS